MVTVYGVDHPGIVHAAAAALAERDVDITDLNTRLLEQEDGRCTCWMMEVSLPEKLIAGELSTARLRVAEREAEVTLRSSSGTRCSPAMAVRPAPATRIRRSSRSHGPSGRGGDRAGGDRPARHDALAPRGCVGLAALQIGAPVQLVAVDVSQHPKARSSHGLLVLVNPRVVRAEGAEVAREGCPSIPALTANVRRATRIEVEARDTRFEAEDFEARCRCPSFPDHLDGILVPGPRDSLATDVPRRKRYS